VRSRRGVARTTNCMVIAGWTESEKYRFVYRILAGTDVGIDRLPGQNLDTARVCTDRLGRTRGRAAGGDGWRDGMALLKGGRPVIVSPVGCECGKPTYGWKRSTGQRRAFRAAAAPGHVEAERFPSLPFHCAVPIAVQLPASSRARRMLSG
jgi:hypothetical protein